MDERDTIKRLCTAFPSLSVSEAKGFLETNHWDLNRAFKAAEKNEEEKINKKDATNFYSGGGLMTTSPGEISNENLKDDENVQELLNSIFRKAKDGAQQHEGFDEGNRAFFGQGRRLGHTENPSPPIASTLLAHRAVSLDLYQDGFLLENGEFIPLDSSEGKEGMKEMSQGYVPAFLQKLFPRTELSLTLHDKSSLPYSLPMGQSCQTSSGITDGIAFGGTGHRLAGTSTNSSSSSNGALTDNWPAAKPLVLDENEEQSFIVLVDTKGKRKEYKIHPLRHTLSDVHSLAKEMEPNLSAFSLVVRGVPPRKLTSDMADKTIFEAKLTRAVITVQKV